MSSIEPVTDINEEGQPATLPVKLTAEGLTVITASIGRDSLRRAQESVWHQQLKVRHLIVLDPDKISAGVTKTRGVRKAETEWVAFLDDDDELDPMFSTWWQQNRDDCDAMLFLCDNRVLRRIVPEPGYDQPANLTKSHIGLCLAVKREIFLQHPYWNERDMGLPEDWEFIRWLKDDTPYKVKVIPHVAYIIHSHGGRK